MNLNYNISFSNRLDFLANILKEDLFDKDLHPLTKRYIVISNERVKRFLTTRFLSDISAGIEFVFPDQLFKEIALYSNPQYRFPSSLELSFRIESILKKLFKDHNPDPIFEPLLSSAKRPDKLFFITDKIASLFMNYGIWGGKALRDWRNGPGWQQYLFNQLFHDEIVCPADFIDRELSFPFPIFVFNCSYIPKVHLDLFQKLSTRVYQFSPCQYFWEDLVSDQEKVFLERNLKKRGAKEGQIEEIGHYLTENNRFFANLSSLGRKHLSELMRSDPLYRDLYIEEESQTLLSHIKNQILRLEKGKRIADAALDDSLQIHAAMSKLREVEILKENCIALLSQNRDFTPADIVILSPSLDEYVPYIYFVFEGIDIQIFDMERSKAALCKEALDILFSIARSDFEMSDLKRLFSFSPFLKRAGLTKNEGKKVLSYLKKANVRRGLSTGMHSLQKGFDRLLLGLCYLEGDAPFLNEAEFTESALLGNAADLIYRLAEDLKKIDGEHALKEWAFFIKSLIEVYFDCEGEEESFFDHLHALLTHCRDLETMTLSFERIEKMIEALFRSHKGSYRQHDLNAISFARLKEGSALQSKALFLLGMQEENFPHKTALSSLYDPLLKKEGYYMPLESEKERYLFLEAILNAEHALYISYVKYAPEDQKEMAISVVCQELLSYMQELFGEECVKGIYYDHPPFAFDPLYFKPGSRFKSHSLADYQLAKLRLEKRERKTSSFIPDFAFPEPVIEECTIDLKELKTLSYNPIEFYLNAALDLKLHEEKNPLHEDFLFSRFVKGKMRSRLLEEPLADQEKWFLERGELPVGIFKESAFLQVQEEMELYEKKIKELGRIEQIELSDQMESAEEIVVLPPLELNLKGKKIRIVGKLGAVCAEGMLAHGEKELIDLVRFYPFYLVYLLAVKGKAEIIFTKSFERISLPLDNPEERLMHFIEYYFIAKKALSPMHSNWVKALLLQELADFEKAVHAEAFFPEQHLDWLKQRQEHIAAKEIYEQWSPYLKQLYQPLIEYKNSV